MITQELYHFSDVKPSLSVTKVNFFRYETVNINTKVKPGWFFDKSSLGLVPVLEKDGDLMVESLITSDYLNEAYPNPSLYPSNPWKKAQDRGLVELWSNKVSSVL